MWSWELLDLDGVTTNILNPSQVTITRNLNAASNIILRQAATSGISSTARVIRGYRDGVLRATGKVQRVTGLGSLDGIEQVELAALDGLGLMQYRTLIDENSFTASTPRAIISTILTNEVARSATGTGLYLNSTGDSGPLRDRVYNRGKNVGEIIRQLAEVDDGFYFRVDPMDFENLGFYFWSELIILYPNAGEASTAKFEYGPSTIGNLTAAQADVLPPVNSVLAFGASEGDEQLSVQVENLISQANYGLFDTVINHPDVIDTNTLIQHAYDILRPDEKKTYRVEVAQRTNQLYVPNPWDEFDVGDTVNFKLAGISEALQFVGSLRVTSFTLTVDANGVERLASLELQE